MRITVSRFVLAMGASLLLCGTALAHHSMSMYDRGHDTTFKATIVEFDYSNPHSQIRFTVTDDHGSVTNWVAEGPGPNRLAKRGWNSDSLKPGDQVTIVGNCNKNGSPTMRFEKIIFGNGQELEAYPRNF
jgi:hypothetical protein